jgi:hypothetical protein
MSDPSHSHPTHYCHSYSSHRRWQVLQSMRWAPIAVTGPTGDCDDEACIWIAPDGEHIKSAARGGSNIWISLDDFDGDESNNDCVFLTIEPAAALSLVTISRELSRATSTLSIAIATVTLTYLRFSQKKSATKLHKFHAKHLIQPLWYISRTGALVTWHFILKDAIYKHTAISMRVAPNDLQNISRWWTRDSGGKATADLPNDLQRTFSDKWKARGGGDVHHCGSFTLVGTVERNLMRLMNITHGKLERWGNTTMNMMTTHVPRIQSTKRENTLMSVCVCLCLCVYTWYSKIPFQLFVHETSPSPFNKLKPQPQNGGSFSSNHHPCPPLFGECTHARGCSDRGCARSTNPQSHRRHDFINWQRWHVGFPSLRQWLVIIVEKI